MLILFFTRAMRAGHAAGGNAKNQMKAGGARGCAANTGV
jgi:hypothetical protein